MRGSIRLFVTGAFATGGEVPLERSDAHYLARVMRRHAGSEIVLCNGRDGAWQARITALGPRGGRAILLHQLCPQKPEPGPWLAFAHLKRAATEFVVQKATELGVERLLPLRTEHSIATVPNLARLGAIAKEASEQSERLTCPEIVAVPSLSDLLSDWPAARALFAAVERRSLPLPIVTDKGAGLLVGPEGGFTEGELDLLVRTPFVRPISLGPRVLRAETAAIAGLALIGVSAGNPI